MKKLLLLILSVLAVSFAACDKDDSGENSFLVDGRTVNLDTGLMEYYGYSPYSKCTEVDLTLINYAAGSLAGFTMNVPEGNTKLVAGTYVFEEDSDKDFMFSYGAAVAYGYVNDDEIEVTSGTVTVGVSGSTYTIAVDCKLKSGNTIKGTYKGALKWIDESEE